MQSINFEVLRKTYPQLADLGALAEQYIHTDPEGSAAKLRVFGEHVTHAICTYYSLPGPLAKQFDVLKSFAFESNVPETVLGKLHALRMSGNYGSHFGRPPVTSATALARLRDAHELTKWWAMVSLNVDLGSLPAFRTPPLQPLIPDLQAKLQQQERLIATTLAQLDSLSLSAQPARPDEKRLKVLRSKGAESAHFLSLMPDEFGVQRGVKLFRHLADQANAGKPHGISYGYFLAYLHGKQSFRDVAGRNYLPGDSGTVISLAWSITEANGGRIPVTAVGRTIQTGMDTYIWSSRAPYDRPEKAWQNPKSTLPYTQADWQAVFPARLRVLVDPRT